MKKKLDELNRKIRHSRKKHDRMIHKRNALRKVIEDLKSGTKPEPMPEPEWNFKECERPLEGLTGAIGSMADPEWTIVHSLAA